jgi:hypothetical protein
VSADPHCSKQVEVRPAPDQNNENIMRRPERSPETIDSADDGGDRFANLHADLKAKVQRIADGRTLENVWHFFNSRRNPFPFNDVWAGQGIWNKMRDSI